MINTLESFKIFLTSLGRNTKPRESDLLVSYGLEIPNVDIKHLLKENPKYTNKFIYWSRPDENFIALSSGNILSLNRNGSDRINYTETIIKNLEQKFQSNWDKIELDNIPLFLGGMKFSTDEESKLWNDFADSEWFIPENLIIKKTKNFAFYNFMFSPEKVETIINRFESFLNKIFKPGLSDEKDSELRIQSKIFVDPDEKSSWTKSVTQALEKIEAGEFKKIVLSRQVILELSDKPILHTLLEKLERKYPKCYIFAYSNNNSIFFGASPEKLAKISNGWIEADALAGSIKRGIDSEEDELFANELLQSQKNLKEQNTVVEFIAESFSSFTNDVIYDSKPIIRKLPNIQHLWTPIRAKLNTDKTLFSLLKEIHPTPAICGVPWSSALSSIVKMEPHKRGLFSGIVGWFNFNNEGEFAVAIRSALLQNKSLYAYAGCGIVEGSDPNLEYDETELKLKPILSLFDNETEN